MHCFLKGRLHLHERVFETTKDAEISFILTHPSVRSRHASGASSRRP